MGAAGHSTRLARGESYTRGSANCQGGAERENRPGLARWSGVEWLDPQEHDGTATPDNFLNALHDALIKNYRETLFDHPGLAERYEFAPDARSATFWLRPGIKFHNGEPVTVEDVKFSFENYRGRQGRCAQEQDGARGDCR